MNQVSRTTKVLLGAFTTLIAIWLVAPMLIVFPMSFTADASFQFPPREWSARWYESFFTSPQWLGALGNSVLIGVLTAIIATVAGTIAAIAMHRSKSRMAQSAQMLLLTPMIVPPIIAGAGIYTFFLKSNLVGTVFGFVMVHIALALPLVVIAVNASLSGYDQSLELAAASLGAGRLKVFLTVTVPLIAPGVAAGAVFAFVTSFDEVIVSQFMVSPTLQTLPMMMYSSVTRTTDPTIAAAASLILGAIIFAFIFFQFVVAPLARRSKKRTGS
ncbi:putative spermidine/putrescine transport system permease protein [Leucobacter exalbidus]|uniref:Spermidine/putrescine transport system permease protein n=1 Tax=Leucobacter exalbidus TaxID=662960 RepID=A0A940PTP4_9MICO|nr:ABC transporter permease [Leucobacter exalbidus]MBP1326030.1 putative spermidine/putrescine transport system permease protein [Leucobacter exalbidus]